MLTITFVNTLCCEKQYSYLELSILTVKEICLLLFANTMGPSAISRARNFSVD